MAGLWYRTGTVSVTNGSNKVIGYGTTWKTDTSKPDKGHTFWGPDDKHYEVDSVESDTVLYLVKAYAGASAAGQSYEIDITRTSTIPAISRDVAALLAYAQGQYDGWQAVLTGAGDVVLTAPDGQTVTVPALSNMLSKSGNLAGLTDKAAARTNMGLGDAATKGVGTTAGAVAAGDHDHTFFISVGGDPNTYYPVLLNGSVLRGVTISRYVHQDGTWYGALRFHINGIGGSWGGDYPYLDYSLTQLWGSGFTTGCLADVAAASGSDGVFVWLRGGRSYSINGIGVTATVYLSGVTEPNGIQRMPMSSGPLYQLNNVASLDGVQLYKGAPSNNKPYWNGENLPVEFGTFSPTAFGLNAAGSPSYLNATGLFYRHGMEVKFELTLQFSSLGGAKGLFCIGGLPFICRPETDVAVSICAYSGLADQYDVVGAAVSAANGRAFLIRKNGATNNAIGVSCEEFAGAGTLQLSGSYIIA